MIRLALAQPGTAVLSFDLCCATPVLPVATGRQCSPPRRLLPRETINAPRQQAASVQIPIASDAQLRHTSRGFLLWRFAYAGPTCPPRHHHGAAIRKPSHKRTHALHKFLSHSITSSARLSSLGGTSMPSCFAVLRFITRWYLVGCTTGSSDDFSPIRPT